MPRAGLTREIVVGAAAQIVDQPDVGFEGLSLSDLAMKLRVQTPSLYKHIAGLHALRRELTLLGLRELYERLSDACVGRSGGDAVRALAQAYRAFAGEHPGLYVAAVGAPDPGDAELVAESNRVVALVVRSLEGYGLQDDDAIHAVRCIRSALHGFVSLEAAHGFGLPLDREETFRRLINLLIAGLRVSDTGASTGTAESAP